LGDGNSPDLARRSGNRSPTGGIGMLSARTIYGEIFDNDEAFRLFCAIATIGEA
jgi:hypothetical protein